jgi:sugar phosphate isomerase/epimerase
MIKIVATDQSSEASEPAETSTTAIASAHPRLSLNQATTKRWGLEQAVQGCVRAGLGGIGLWRDAVAQLGARRAARVVADAGLSVTSLCRGGFMTASAPSARAAAHADNLQAIEEAATVGAPVLVLVVGGLPEGSRDLAGARSAMVDAVGKLVPAALGAGVRLALEPLHPQFCADRAVLCTLGQALDIAETFPAEAVGVCVDTYHVWWDPQLFAQLARSRGRTALYQLADWVVPLCEDALLSRGHLGTGCIDFSLTGQALASSGYEGWIEVEIFRQEVWDAPGEATTARVVADFARLVAPYLGPASGN